MKEYYIDLLEFNDVLAQWLVDQGATLYLAEGWESPTWKDFHILLGKRRIHKYAGSNQVRIFFDDSNLNIATAMLLIHSSKVFRHNIKVEELE